MKRLTDQELRDLYEGRAAQGLSAADALYMRESFVYANLKLEDSSLQRSTVADVVRRTAKK